MKLNNVRQIRAEDFPEELQQPMGQLGGILNSFMQEVVELADKRIDFENKVENIKTVDITVDSTGKPLLNNKIATDLSTVRGHQVIDAINLSNPSIYPTQQPFISFTRLAGGFIQVNNITGLQANNKYRLTIIFY
jgi:hypothetical protein